MISFGTFTAMLIFDILAE
nr:hypothetical protein [Enterococcus sp.]